MSTLCLEDLGAIGRTLQQLAAHDSRSATAHKRGAIASRFDQHAGRASRIERGCARAEADAAELRDLNRHDIGGAQ